MKSYEALFGIYSIRVNAENKEEALQKIKAKWQSYKDGSRVKDHIKPYIDKLTVNDILEVRLWRGGVWLPVEEFYKY